MRGCLTCRQRHLKCDKTGVECLRCQRSGRRCIPAPARPEEITFRHGQNPSLRAKGPPRYGESDLAFPDDQTWVETPPDVAFEDETDRTAADYHVIGPETMPFGAEATSDSRSSASLATMTPPVVPTGLLPSFSPGDLAHPRALPASRPSSVNSLLPADTLVARPKLASLNEAFLLRHYRKALGAWLDACDFERHFSTEVVDRAPLCALLLYACLAISARHLCHTTKSVPPHVADEYHERCIAILLPVLENRDYNISIEILLASTVILRFFEQISSQHPSCDLQRHLLAGSVYISSHVDCAISGGLAEASFWVFVIQDIQFALAYQNPLRLTFSPFEEKLRQAWASQTLLDDRYWTHRAIWILAETINYCYSSNTGESQLDVIDGDALREKICSWESEHPAEFQPLHFSPADPRNNRPFPIVWYTSPWHATAIQHICMAKALIREHDLRVMHVGPDSDRHARRLNEEVMENLSVLFGIALSADDDPSARTMACHALCACGSWIRDSQAQNILLDLLRRTEAENGWPWTFMMQKLTQDWRLTVR